MSKSEKLLAQWSQLVPKDGAPCKDVVLVMASLGMTVTTDGQNHKYGRHALLIDSDSFPLGGFRVNCHFRGKQGVAHPAGIRDLLRAARIIQAKE